MTEDEWLSGSHPTVLAEHLCSSYRLNRTKAGRRRFWLLACACCRRAWNLFESEPTCAVIVIAAERFADGEGPFADVQNLDKQLNVPNYGHTQSVMLAARSLAYTNAAIVASSAAEHCAQALARDLVFPEERQRIVRHELLQAACLMRCIFGNPFRPVAFEPAWRTSDAVALARGIYADRAFDRMPILADALQDAGCASADVLTHCREANVPHARGCWVVDRVLELR